MTYLLLFIYYLLPLVQSGVFNAGLGGGVEVLVQAIHMEFFYLSFTSFPKIYKLRYKIYKLRYTTYKLRYAIYKLRYTIYKLRYTIY